MTSTFQHKYTFGGFLILNNACVITPAQKWKVVWSWNYLIKFKIRICLRLLHNFYFFRLISLRLYTSMNCSSERVEIWDTSKITDNVNGTLLAKVCGSSDSFPVFRSSGNKMRVYFFSRFLRRNKGFNAIVSFSYGEKYKFYSITKLYSSNMILNLNSHLFLFFNSLIF